MNKINAIVAVSECPNSDYSVIKYGIGKNDKLVWNIPDEMKYFLNIVKDKTIIVGRKTYDKLPKSFIKSHEIYVISNSLQQHNENISYHTLESIIKLIKDEYKKEYYLIGGGMLYETFAKLDLIDTFYVSKISRKDDKYYEFDTYLSDSVLKNMKIISSNKTSAIDYGIKSGVEIEVEVEIEFLVYQK